MNVPSPPHHIRDIPEIVFKGTSDGTAHYETLAEPKAKRRRACKGIYRGRQRRKEA